MSGQNLGGAASNQSSGSADGGGGFELGKRKRRPRKKKHIHEQRFVIHPNDLRATRSELCTAQRSTSGCTTIPLHDDISENEIREILEEKLPKLKGKRYQFLTKGLTSNIFCPCSLKCEDAAHVKNPFAEWNGKNTKRMAKGNRVVYIFSPQETTMPVRSGESGPGVNPSQAQNGSPRASTSTRTHLDSRVSVTTMPVRNGESGPGVNPSQAQNGSMRASTPTSTHLDSRISVKDELLPYLATKRTSLTDEDITSLVETFTLKDQNQNIRRRQEQQQQEEDEDEDDDDDDDVDDDDSDDEEEEEEQQQQQMQVDEETPAESTLISTGRTTDEISASENRIATDSAYDTLHTGSTTTIFPGDRAHQSQLAFSSPLNTPTELVESWRNQGRVRTAIILAKIDDITPPGGSVEGGYNFFITLDTSSVEPGAQFQVMFGDIPPVPAERISDSFLKGKVPKSPIGGKVDVQVLNLSSGETISDTGTFTYTDEKSKVKQGIENMDGKGLEETLIYIANRMSEMRLKSKQETSEPGKPGGEKTQALSLLRMIVDTAAKINAMDFFRILFRTHVGRSVFKSFKDEQPLLEEIARGNGHDELACLLEEKHLMYRDDENESDDEVDWKELAKAIEKYQALNGETAEKKSIQSTASSERIQGYLADAESSTSLSSLQVSVGEECFEDTFEEQLATPQSECREEPDGSAAVIECSLPSPAVPCVGRNLECEQIVANLTSNHRRIGVIYGAQGIGKTTVAVQVGHMLHSKGWSVHYRHCRDQDASLEISALLEAQAINRISHFTLFILDNLDIYIESDGYDKMSTALQSFVESANENGFVGLLFAIRKGMHVLENLSFSFNLQPLNSNFAVELLTTTSGNIPVGGLKTIAEACDHFPRTLMIARGLIEDGMSETDIINTISSSDKFRKDKAHKLDDCHSLKGEESSYSAVLHLPDRGHVYPMFAPKEVASLRKKLRSFDAGSWEHFYPDTDQAICSLMEGLDTTSVLDSLNLERTDDLKGCLKIQQGSEHLETAEGEFYGQKSKDARALKSLVLPSFGSPRCCLEEVYLPRNTKTESIPLYSSVTVEPIREVVASKNILQKGQKAITQTPEESVSNVCFNEPSSESDSSRHSRSLADQLPTANQKERKSVCLSLARKKVVAILLGLLMVACSVGIYFIVQGSSYVPHKFDFKEITSNNTREACSNGPSTLHCDAARNVTAVVDVEWKVKVPGIEWITFSHCNNQLGRCVVTTPMLTKGIKVLNSSLDTVTLQRIAENKTNDHTRIMCQVHYLNYPLKVNIYEINFSATCVWIPKGRDLNLTRILLNMLSCERVVDIDLCSINGNRFAYCNSCQGCTKTNSTDGNHLVPVFWNRLQVKRGSLLLTGIQEDDDGLMIKVKVHMQTPRRDNGTNMVYTLRIFVNSSRGFPENKTLPTASAKLDGVGANFPCKPEQIRVNDTVGKRYTCYNCPVCNPGSQPSVACGSSVKLGTLIHCIPCNHGKTYSDKNDKSQCKLAAVDDCTKFKNRYWNGTQCVECSRCPRGFGVKTTCSSKQDTECQPCWPGYDYSNNTGFEPCILCDQYSNCLEGNAKKIKDCTIFSPTICEGCADGNFFDSSYGNNGVCVECSSPCSTFEDEARPCSTAHDRKCTIKSTVLIFPVLRIPSTDSAKEIPNIGGTSSGKTLLVKELTLLGCAGFIGVVTITCLCLVLMRRRRLRKHVDSKRHARTANARGNEMQQRTPLIKPCADNGLDLPIKDLTIVGKRFIARMLNDKDCYGYFYWEIIAEKLGLFEECKAWEGVENPSEKLLTAYGEKEGSTIRYLIKALREAGVIHFSDEIERFFITCYQDSGLFLSDISLDIENTLVKKLDVCHKGEYGWIKLGSAFGVDKNDLNYLETAYKRDVGSPTKELLDILNTQDRTVADVINALKGPKVNRSDIALHICQLIRSERK